MRRLIKSIIYNTFVLVSLCGQTLKAQNDVSGVYKNYHAIQTTGNHEILSSSNRFQLQFGRNAGTGQFYSSLDVVHRYHESQEIELILREIYADWFFNNADLRIGKHNIIWGRTIGGFITDIVTPVDLREFLTLDPDDLRIGISALNFTYYRGNDSFQIVAAPLFQKDLLPNPDSRWFPVQTITSPMPLQFTEYTTPPSLVDFQLALRYGFRENPRLDADLFVMRWKHPVPAYAIDIRLFDFPGQPTVNLQETYENSLMAGFSARYEIHSNWHFTAEALYVKQRLFPFLPVPVSLLEDALTDPASALQLIREFELRDDGYLINKPWLHAMVGAETEIFGTSISIQAYLERIINYEDNLLPQNNFPYLTLFATRTLLRDRLQMISLSRYNFYADDFWFQLQGVYELSDGFQLSLGANLFGGEDITPFYGHFTFSQFRQNSFAFTRLAFFF